MKFRKKPVVIDAIQWDGRNTFQVLEFMGKKPDLSTSIAQDKFYLFEIDAASKGLDVTTLEDGADLRAKHVASVGDYIIKGVFGEFYPCKPAIFLLTYEEVK
jgi:hypothetical protein